jgi:hypothetical protein
MSSTTLVEDSPYSCYQPIAPGIYMFPLLHRTDEGCHVNLVCSSFNNLQKWATPVLLKTTSFQSNAHQMCLCTKVILFFVEGAHKIIDRILWFEVIFSNFAKI